MGADTNPKEEVPVNLDTLTDEERAVAERAVIAHRLSQWRDLIGGEKLLIYGAKQNVDLTEGKGGVATRGHFIEETEARRAARCLCGVQGGDESCLNPAEVPVYVSVEAWLLDTLSVGGKRHFQLSEYGRRLEAEAREGADA